jgi:iron-sulfur cluster insertion protein
VIRKLIYAIPGRLSTGKLSIRGYNMEEVLEQPQLVKMAPGAIAKIKELIAEENNPNLKLRMFVSGGGCSGMQYGFTFEEAANEDDFNLEFDGIHLLIDAMSSQYLQGAEVDYTESLQGSSFSIKNPQAQTTCGCGSSFNPG